MTRRVLGSGLGNILTDVLPDGGKLKTSIHQKLESLSVDEVVPRKNQPRKNFDENLLRELADSIKEKGIVQPLVVRKIGDSYELVAGERRWRAAQMAGLKQIPVVVCEIDDNQVLAYSIIENIQRQDLDPIEEAMSFKQLLDELNLTHEEVAKAVGRSRVAITNSLRLLNLTNSVKEMLISRKLEMGHARALLGLLDEQQTEVARLIFDRKMTVRATESYISGKKSSLKQRVKDKKAEKFSNWELALSKKLGARVQIQVKTSGEGKMIFSFDELRRLEAIVNKLFKC